MFLATLPRIATRNVQLSGDRTGTIERKNLSGRAGLHLRYQLSTEQQPDALQASATLERGFYYFRTQVRAAPAVVEIGPFEVQADTYKALVFGATGDIFFSKIVDIGPARIPQRDGSSRPPAMKLDEPPIFFCTETAPVLTSFLRANWIGIDPKEQMSRLVKEKAVTGAFLGGVAGVASSMLGAKTGVVKGFLLGGVPGAVGGSLIGGFMGFIHGAELARGKDHDIALAEVLTIFTKLSATDAEPEDIDDAAAQLQALVDANPGKRKMPFGLACEEVSQYINQLRMNQNQDS